MGRVRLATELRVWAIASGWVFAVLVSADLAGGPNDTRGGLASRLSDLLGGGTPNRVDLLRVGGRLLALAGCAAAVGLLVRAVTLGVGMRSATGPDREALDYGEAADLGIGPDQPWEGRLDRLVALKQQGDLLRRGRPGDAPDADRDSAGNPL